MTKHYAVLYELDPDHQKYRFGQRHCIESKDGTKYFFLTHKRASSFARKHSFKIITEKKMERERNLN